MLTVGEEPDDAQEVDLDLTNRYRVFALKKQDFRDEDVQRTGYRP